MIDWGLTLGMYLALGAFAGLLAGLLGVGGGLIIVPVLAALFLHQGVAAEVIMHLALGTSLASIVLTSLSSIRAHQERGAILWPQFRQLTPGIVFGAALGGWLAGMMTTAWLKPLFAVFELGVASYMLSAVQPHTHRPLPGQAKMSAAGGIIGLVSSLVGIGGGTRCCARARSHARTWSRHLRPNGSSWTASSTLGRTQIRRRGCAHWWRV